MLCPCGAGPWFLLPAELIAGIASDSPRDIIEEFSNLDLPIAVGFGVRTPEQASQIARAADGVVVGSALVDLVKQHGDNAAGPLRELTSALAEAVHSAR